MDHRPDIVFAIGWVMTAYQMTFGYPRRWIHWAATGWWTGVVAYQYYWIIK